MKTLVFVNSRRRAGYIAEKIASLRTPAERGESARLDALAGVVREEFAAIGVGIHGDAATARIPELPLVRCLRERVAFHHAALPDRVRRGIEEAAHEGEIDVIVATTTLAEGLNLPMNCVVLADLDFRGRDATQRTAISKMLCRNIVGRAGRPFEDTCGEAIVVAPQGQAGRITSAHRASPTDRAKSYWVRRNDQLEPVQSSLRALCAEVRAGHGLDGPLALVYQGQLLAALQEGIVDPADPRRFIAESLLAHEPDAGSILAELLEHTRGQLEYIQATVEVGDYAAFRRTGLPVLACLEMQRHIRMNIASDPQFYRIGQVGWQRHEAARVLEAPERELLEMAFVPSRPEGIQDPIGVLVEWISGKSVASIARDRFGARIGVDDILKCSYQLQREVKPNATWAFSGFRVLLDDWKERMDNSLEYSSTVSLMPRYVDYGVNHPVAVYMLDIGALERRDDALTAAYAFDRSERLTYDGISDFHFALDWMKRAELHAFTEYTDSTNAERIHTRLRAYGQALPEERVDAASCEYGP